MLSEYKQQVIDLFNSRTSYDAEGEKQPREAKKLLASVPVKLGQTILDIATGTGLISIPAALKVAPNGSVIGVDLSPVMLKQARAKIAAQGIDNLELIQADIELIDFNPAQFDRIFCCSSMTFIVDLPRILNKCYGWLKPRGYLAFTCPYKDSYMAEIKVKLCQNLFGIDLPHINRPLWTPKKCRNLLQQSGFKDIEIELDRTKRFKTENYVSVWQGGDFYPRGNPLQDLSTSQSELLGREYQNAISDRITKDGVWEDSTTLYVKASK